MLLGTFVPKLDDKGRVILPAKFRDEFAAGLVMTRGQEGCVYVYSQREFEALHERMAEQAPKLGKQGRDYLRMFLSGAAQEIPDKQFRVTIPPMLREYAGLDATSRSSVRGPAPRSGTPRPGPVTPRRPKPASPTPTGR